MEDDIFDINKPLFLIKLNTDGMSRQTVDLHYQNVKKNFHSEYCNIWIMNSNESDIRCIWAGKNDLNKHSEYCKLLEESGTISKSIIEESNLTDKEKSKFIKILREHSLKQLLED